MLRSLDLALLRLLRSRGHAQSVERAVLRFSRLGEHGSLWLVLALTGAALDRPKRTMYVRAARVVVLTVAANVSVKLAIRRTRPLLEDLPALIPTVSGLSYPSQHSSTSFAGARALSAALPAPPLYSAAAAMALSRSYLGVHYPSDLLAGALLGAAMAELVP